MNNPLDRVIDWHQSAYDSLRVTRRAITKSIPSAITEKVVFFDKSVEICEERLQSAIQELENVVVLVLVAVFERTLREHVSSRMNTAMNSQDPVQEKIRERLGNDIEYWRFADELVDVFVSVPEANRGNVKQLLKLRDWVAHGHFLNKPKPNSADVRTTYARLTAFLQAAKIIQ